MPEAEPAALGAEGPPGRRHRRPPLAPLARCCASSGRYVVPPGVTDTEIAIGLLYTVNGGSRERRDRRRRHNPGRRAGELPHPDRRHQQQRRDRRSQDRAGLPWPRRDVDPEPGLAVPGRVRRLHPGPQGVRCLLRLERHVPRVRHESRGAGRLTTAASRPPARTTFRQYPDYIEIMTINLDRMATLMLEGVNAQGYFGGWSPQLGRPVPGRAKVGVVLWDCPRSGTRSTRFSCRGYENLGIRACQWRCDPGDPYPTRNSDLGASDRRGVERGAEAEQRRA